MKYCPPGPNEPKQILARLEDRGGQATNRTMTLARFAALLMENCASETMSTAKTGSGTA